MSSETETAEATRQWWSTSITDISADAIRIRGYAVEDLIGRAGLGDMVWLLIQGELPTVHQSALLEAAMLGAVVHGPLAPSIAVARMAITCGIDINHAVAQGAAVLGDVHGGAIEQAMLLLETLVPAAGDAEAISKQLERWIGLHGRFVPGFGHRFHRHADPRTAPLFELADNACRQGIICGHHLANARALESAIAARKGKAIPMNLDGIAAAIFLELGFAPPVGRGLIVLARSIGILANAWEELSEGRRLKGPVPPALGYNYRGPASRKLPDTMNRGGNGERRT